MYAKDSTLDKLSMSSLDSARSNRCSQCIANHPQVHLLQATQVDEHEEGALMHDLIPLVKSQEQMKAAVAASIAQRAMDKVIDSILHSPQLGSSGL